MSDEIAQRVQAEPLKDFCARGFQRVGVTEENACITADVLVAAGLHGVKSRRGSPAPVERRDCPVVIGERR